MVAGANPFSARTVEIAEAQYFTAKSSLQAGNQPRSFGRPEGIMSNCISKDQIRCRLSGSGDEGRLG
ncbi:hypothetical protein SS05631_b59850 (plasmid) [Sinorhizobium sp. CCBAU 05631]|nr:hypothetical protein SS05631_b59850 [Sinorhizobium sp. CCBAU 05631]